MPKLYPKRAAILSLIVLCFSAAGRAQNESSRIAEREAEWQSYQLPSADFVRYLDSTRSLLLRVPADWKQQNSTTFNAPDGTVLMVSVHAIPDGAPLAEYLAGVLQSLRSIPGGADSIVIRHAEMSGVEAREVSFESPDARGVMMKRIISIAVQGPAAIGLVLITPIATAARAQPYYKSVVESAVIMSTSELDDFEGLRSSVVKENKAERIDEVLIVAAVLDGAGPAERKAAAAKLPLLLSASPGAVLDLAVDRRPAVRAALIDVIAASGNRAYDQFLVRALKDHDLLVAERSARTLARLPEIADLLRSSTLGWYESEPLFRIWPFLGEKVRTQIAGEIFTRPNLKVLSAPLLEERFKNIQAIPPPPPPPRRPEPQTKAPKIPDGKTPQRSKPGAPAGGTTAAKESQANSLFGALSLLQDVPVAECKLPFVEIAGSGSDILTTSALQVALVRRERLPMEPLFKLLDSSTEPVRRLSAVNLAQSGALSDIPRIEERARRLEVQSKPPVAAQETNVSTSESGRPEQGASLAALLRASIKKIRLREQLAAATPGERSGIIKSAMADADVADWVWSEYAREQIEGPYGRGPQPPSEGSSSIPAAPILPLGENIFPPDVKLYAAMPSTSATLEKLADSLAGIQMESARDQAFLVLMLSGMQAQLSKSLGAKPGQSVFGVAGIDFSKPIALATWTAEGARPGLKAAERAAVVVRVADRERFERLLALYQQNIGKFASFPEAVSIAGRFIGLLPAVMPSGVKLLQQNADEPSKEKPAYKYGFRASNNVLGFPVTIIERREADSRGLITPDPICVAYAGDSAILAPDLISLRDALSRLSRGGPALRDSSRFKQASAEGGDVIYMSDLGSLFGSMIASKDRAKDVIDLTEGGALKISNAACENSFRLSFKDASWAKPLQSFDPQQHSAVRDLLPGSTVMYLLAKLDVAAAWRDWKDGLFGADEIKDLTTPWVSDFEHEVLPELGAECGAALMEVPTLDFKSLQWIVFFKLKSDRLERAYREGHLIKNVAFDPTAGFVKLGPGGEVAAVRNGYLIVAANEAALRKLESQNKLASARDFARAVKKAPSEVVAFGGYNLEAATAELVDSLPGDARTEVLLKAFKAIINAFHSQNFYVTASPQGLDGHMSVSLDREGRYSVAELASISKEYRPSYASVEARGTAIVNQRWLASATLRLRSKGPGAIDRIKDDITSSYQNVEKISNEELRVTIRPREVKDVKKVSLPVSGTEFAPFLQPTSQIKSNDKSVIDQARKIAGDDTDAWSVARKLADWTYKNLKWKVVESGDAAHTLITREAACGEFSELYVAMARALGLPARIVVGLAYSGGSFGGHAWAEVYAGQWIELDPTWGTDFVDATHLRESAGELTTYAALNLISIEVVEAPRIVRDFQRSPGALVEKLCEELPAGVESAISVSIDAEAITDQLVGGGAWASLTGAEREQVSSIYRNVVSTLSRLYMTEKDSRSRMRLLKLNESADHADALVMGTVRFSEEPFRIKLVKKGDAWIIMDIVRIDNDFAILMENFRPTLEGMIARRKGRQGAISGLSGFARALTLLDQDAKAGLEFADQELKDDPGNRGLRYAKGLALVRLERTEEAVKIWTRLSEENSPFTPALLELAEYYNQDKTKDTKKAAGLYERYATAVPDDPRPHEFLAAMYEEDKDLTRAETEERAAIERDPRDSDKYSGLARLLVVQRRYLDALAAIDDGAKHGASGDELFASVLAEFVLEEPSDLADAFAAVQPQRMERNAAANLNLAYVRVNAGRAREALPLLKKAIELDPKDADPWIELAAAYRKLGDWRNALAAADSALALDKDGPDAHYNRACALARLGRLNEAMAALNRAVELGEDPSDEDFSQELDLKPLAKLPAFKKLIKEQNK